MTFLLFQFDPSSFRGKPQGRPPDLSRGSVVSKAYKFFAPSHRDLRAVFTSLWLAVSAEGGGPSPPIVGRVQGEGLWMGN